MFAPASWLGIGPVLRHYRTRQDASTYTGGSGIVTHGPVSAWAGAGHWVDMPGSGVPWVVGATIRPHPRLAVNASRRREAFDPLYLREPQTSWSVGLSIRIGEPRTTARALPVAGFDDGRVTIRVAAADCPPTPRIAGDFNGWEPQPMWRAGDYWAFTAALPPGVYNYAFVDADGRWFVPDSVPGRRDDGMGGHVAVLVVPS